MSEAIGVDQHRLLVLCAAGIDWPLLARTAQTRTDLDEWYAGRIQEQSPSARRARTLLDTFLTSQTAAHAAAARVDAELAAADKAGAHLVTVLDDDFPANLRLVPDAPPFVFYLGTLEDRDARSAAVVGNRAATTDGLRRSARMARGLSEHGVIVFSGLALGIDTAAHTAALTAGQRTVAVIGQGITTPVYPAPNRSLATTIVEQGGAIISRFWPTDSPDRWRFPARNITMSGLTQGTVVVEAGDTSGAKMQAEAAAKHGKTVFLLKSLADKQPWAAAMLQSGAAIEVSTVDDVLAVLADADAINQIASSRLVLAQLPLGDL